MKSLCLSPLADKKRRHEDSQKECSTKLWLKHLDPFLNRSGEMMSEPHRLHRLQAAMGSPLRPPTPPLSLEQGVSEVPEGEGPARFCLDILVAIAIHVQLVCDRSGLFKSYEFTQMLCQLNKESLSIPAEAKSPAVPRFGAGRGIACPLSAILPACFLPKGRGH